MTANGFSRCSSTKRARRRTLRRTTTSAVERRGRFFFRFHASLCSFLFRRVLDRGQTQLQLLCNSTVLSSLNEFAASRDLRLHVNKNESVRTRFPFYFFALSLSLCSSSPTQNWGKRAVAYAYTYRARIFPVASFAFHGRQRSVLSVQ